MSEWKVEMFPEEKGFIDEVFSRTIESADGRGKSIIPVRGGSIDLDEEYSEYTEEQTKWLVFCRLQDARYKVGGVQGLRFMNFTYNDKLPEILEDAEAMDKWGVKRMTTDGQPVNDVTGLPMNYVEHVVTQAHRYEWNDKSQGYTKAQTQTLHESYEHEGFPAPEKVVE